MQKLVAEYPEIIADEDGPLLLIRREQPISDSMAGTGRWSVDHLFVTQDGVPVLAELKRATDTRLRREVVGQLLDYAANAAAYWQPGTIAATFANTATAAGANPDELLGEFLGIETDPDSFWRRVDDSFAAGRMKLVFVADVIPPDLARIVEFLNEQMKLQVKAVELNWFEGQGVKAFVPRMIGETERAKSIKAASQGLPPITPAEWIEERVAPLGSEQLLAASNFLKVIDAAGGEPHVPLSRGSVRARFNLAEHGKSIYPLALQVGKRATVYLNLNGLKESHVFSVDSSRKQLYDELVQVVGSLSTPRLDGFPAFDAAKLNSAAVQAGLQAFLLQLVQTAQKNG
jgi:hypothetical protein